MNITWTCARCGQVYSVDPARAGRKLGCRACGFVGVLPVKSDVSEQPPVRPHPQKRTRRPRRFATLRALVLEPSAVQGLSVLLLLLSAIDLFVTYGLLRASSRYYESNPVANWFFQRWNIAGMALFKFGMMGCVIAVSEIVERRRPGYGKFALAVGCAATVFAIWQGAKLLWGQPLAV